MPPAVAQAPIVIRTADCSRCLVDRSTSCAVVTEPSTSETRRRGPRSRRSSPRARRKYAISTPSAIARSSILAVEDRQLAAVARGELPHRELGPGHGGHSLRTSIRRVIAAAGSTAPSRQMSVGPSWQCPQCPTAQRMLRSIETQMRSSGSPGRRAPDHERHHHLRARRRAPPRSRGRRPRPGSGS